MILISLHLDNVFEKLLDILMLLMVLQVVFPPHSNNNILITEGFGKLPHITPSTLRV